jgi:hypothetical protein
MVVLVCDGGDLIAGVMGLRAVAAGVPELQAVKAIAPATATAQAIRGGHFGVRAMGTD